MKLSIIVPVYNAEDSILKLINTILSSKEIFELICVDDGSTDRSLEILKSIKDKRICVFTKQNEGVYKTWRYGLKKASGDYITFFDSDDYIDTAYIQKIFEFINSVGADMLLTPYSIIQGGEKRDQRLPFHDGIYEGDSLEMIRGKLLGGRIQYSKCTKVIKKTYYLDFVNHNMESDISDFEDWLTLISIFSKIKSMYVVNQCFYYYVQHEKSVTRSITSYDKNYRSLLKVIKCLGANGLATEYLESIEFYGARSILYRCVGIKEFSLAKQILQSKRFYAYLIKADISSLEKIILYMRNAKLISVVFKIKKMIVG